jgi:predicted RNA-binding protein with PIN domain
MLTYIIDAFNLIYKVEKLADSAAPHASLLQFLKSNRLTGSRNNKVVVVFDGHDNPDVSGEREYEIIFSGPRSADDVIKERVTRSKNRSQIVVVSDDRDLTHFVSAEGAKVKSMAEFLRNSGHRVQPSADDEKAIGYEERQKIKEELEKVWVKKPPYNFVK